MRLIDADALRADMWHRAFEEDSELQKWDSGCWIRYKLFENVIDDSPTIDAVPAWIPVTERLPEPYSGEYLVTINDGSVYTDILWFDSPGDGRYESCFYKTDDDGYGVVCDDVIAWMPLPQPYKGERKDDETG